jgi:anti-sigma factor RsiW
MSALLRSRAWSLPFLVLSMAAAAPARSRVSECFANHEITQVEAYFDEIWSEGSMYAVLIGAQIFVPAERGLTAEWLHRELAQRLAARRSDAQCPLDVPGVRIAIQSGGPGFWVNISTANEKAAKQVLERARELVR